MASDPRNEGLSQEGGRPNGAEPDDVSEKHPVSGEPPVATAQTAELAEEVEETGPKNRFEEFAARFRRPPESSREQKSGAKMCCFITHRARKLWH